MIFSFPFQLKSLRFNPDGMEQQDGTLRIVQMDLQPRWGGGEQIALLLGTGLHRRGHVVSYICAPGGALQRRVEQENLTVTPVTARSQLDLSALFSLTGTLKRLRPDVLHLHTAKEFVLGALAGRLARVPVVVITRHLVMPVKPLMRWIYNQACDGVACVAAAVQDNLVRGGVRKERTRVIHGAIDVLAFHAGLLPAAEAKKRIGCGSDENIVGMVGSVITAKGHDYFLQAAAQLLKDGFKGKFVIVGDGAARAGLEAETRTLGIADRVLFLGFRRDVAEVMSAFDVFVFASISGEAFPLVILEAMTAGKPVVATAISGVPEVVENKVTGLLIPPRDAPSIAQAVRRLTDDAALSERMAKTAQDRALRFYSADRMVEETEALYKELLAARRIPAHG
jgi:glycosyltransferase involved in cell wall biosynthesis